MMLINEIVQLQPIANCEQLLRIMIMVTAASARDLIQVNTGLSHAYTTLTADIITAQITDYQADCSARLRADPAAHADQFAELSGGRSGSPGLLTRWQTLIACVTR